MKKIEQFQIIGMTISGFKSYEGPTELTFGNPKSLINEKRQTLYKEIPVASFTI